MAAAMAYDLTEVWYGYILFVLSHNISFRVLCTALQMGYVIKRNNYLTGPKAIYVIFHCLPTYFLATGYPAIRFFCSCTWTSTLPRSLRFSARLLPRLEWLLSAAEASRWWLYLGMLYDRRGVSVRVIDYSVTLFIDNTIYFSRDINTGIKITPGLILSGLFGSKKEE